jgi:hypothetical protein
MKVIDHLKTLKTGYQMAEMTPLKYIKFEQKIVDIEVKPHNPVYETSAYFSVRQVGNGYNPSEFEQAIIKKQAAKMVAREIYGEVVDKLYDILDVLYQEGKYDDKVTKMVSSLADELLLKD